MRTSMNLQVALAFLIFVLGILQAWDSGAFEAGLPIVLLISLAIPLTPVASPRSLAGAFHYPCPGRDGLDLCRAGPAGDAE